MWSRFWRAIVAAVRGALGLSDVQQRSLMTWGLLGGIVAVTGVIIWLVDRNDAHFAGATEAVQLMIASANADTIKLLVGVMGLMAGAAVLIARGGETVIKLPGGIEISARGAAAAKELAKADLPAIAASPAPEGDSTSEEVRP